MINMSCKACYALAAMLELARHHNDKHLSIRQIAGVRDIPQNYLEQLLVALKKSGMVRSFRGANGGYALAKHPAEINVREVLENLEGPITVSQTGTLGWYWKDVTARLTGVFDETLESLAARDEQMQDQSFYSI